ncbi:glycosyltransferase family 2 protein, partial [Candidatus Parcubacteria bacterium]
MKSHFITIIIPTYNSQKHIKACLESIKNQDYKPFEVIIVDQSSTDDTIKIAKEYGCKTIIRPRPQFYSPPSVSRNVGAKEAKGEILYHVDSDMMLEKGLLSEIVKLISERYDVLIVHEKDITKGFWSKCKAFERRCYWGDDKIESARVVKRSLFEQVGGYDENVSSGEDFNIHKKYKSIGKVGFCKAAVRHNLSEL